MSARSFLNAVLEMVVSVMDNDQREEFFAALGMGPDKSQTERLASITAIGGEIAR